MGWVADPFGQTNGLVEGDPLSVLFCNELFLVSWLRLRCQAPRVVYKTFLDDAFMRVLAEFVDQLEVAWRESELFSAFSGQILNTGKSKGFGTSAAARRAVRRILPADVQVVLLATNLGVDLIPGWQRAMPTVIARLSRAVDMMRRIGCLALPRRSKLVYVIGGVTPSYVYEAECSQLPVRESIQLRRAVARGLWGAGRALRSLEVLFTIVLPGHVVDPPQAFLMAALQQLRRALRRDAAARAAWCDEWAVQSRAPPRPGGPAAPMANVWHYCSMLGWKWVEPLRFERPGLRDLPLLGGSDGLWDHEVRESLRRWRWSVQAPLPPR